MEFNESKYIGKQFVHGETDCYSLVRDFYKNEFDIELTNYARADNWWNEGQNLYLDNFKKEGFYLLDDLDEPQFGDLYLIAFQAKVACHAAIYVGENKVLHHIVNRLSKVDRYQGYLRNWTVARIRHMSQKKNGKERKLYDFNKRFGGKA